VLSRLGIVSGNQISDEGGAKRARTICSFYLNYNNIISGKGNFSRLLKTTSSSGSFFQILFSFFFTSSSLLLLKREEREERKKIKREKLTLYHDGLMGLF
jgi:hypothetical protein